MSVTPTAEQLAAAAQSLARFQRSFSAEQFQRLVRRKASAFALEAARRAAMARRSAAPAALPARPPRPAAPHHFDARRAAANDLDDHDDE